MTIEEIRAKYGDDAADKIQNEIDYLNGKTAPYIIKVEEGGFIHEVFLASRYVTWIYQVNAETNEVFSDSPKTYSRYSAERSLKLMEGFGHE